MKELNKALEEIQSIERAERQLDRVNQELDREYKELDKLQSRVDEEYKDVEKLEKMSLKGLFYKVLGDKEQQLEQERQEYLQAVLKFNEYKKTLEILEFEKKVLEEKLQQKGDIQRKKAAIFKEIEEKLIASNTSEGQELARLDQQIVQEIQLKIEVKEALVIGAKVAEMIRRMLKALQTASNWGTYDMMGGNSTASYMKHSSIDTAKNLAYQTKYILEQFERELEDVYGAKRIRLDLNIDSFHKFTDIFFDNLITDWIVQQKIQNALSSVNSTHDKVRRIINALNVELKKLDQKIDYIENQKKDILFNMTKK